MSILYNILLLIFIIISSTGDKLVPKSEIIRYVNDNNTELNSLVQDILNGSNYDNIFDNTIVEDIDISDSYMTGNYIKFDCGGIGFGSETEYVGFYYKSDDVKKIYCQVQKEFVPYENGWIYREPYGDNIVYLEQIADNYYYYYESY